ncbi:MAG: hypothetical protein FWC89_03235 [Defluviitaleaceae bacterium]|nr:hypothetical protein [Defluviitaleaceae bacterium]
MKNEIVIQNTFQCSNLWKAFLKYSSLLASFGIAIFFGLMFLITLMDEGLAGNIYEILMGILILLIFGGAPFYYVREMLSGSKVVTLSNNGVTLHSSDITIPWENISSFKRCRSTRVSPEGVQFTYDFESSLYGPHTVFFESFSTAYTARQIVKMAKKFHNFERK